MIDFGTFQFACPPGIGGSWLLAAMRHVGVPAVGGDGRMWTPFHGPNNDNVRVTAVRHPCRWLQKCRKMFFGISDDARKALSPLDKIPLCRTSDEFAAKYMDQCPGVFGTIHHRYKADVTMRIEDQPWALIELLESLGVPKERRNQCLRVPTTWKDCGMLGRDTRMKIMGAESDLCSRYDYF